MFLEVRAEMPCFLAVTCTWQQNAWDEWISTHFLKRWEHSIFQIYYFLLAYLGHFHWSLIEIYIFVDAPIFCEVPQSSVFGPLLFNTEGACVTSHRTAMWYWSLMTRHTVCLKTFNYLKEDKNNLNCKCSRHFIQTVIIIFNKACFKHYRVVYWRLWNGPEQFVPFL